MGTESNLAMVFALETLIHMTGPEGREPTSNIQVEVSYWVVNLPDVSHWLLKRGALFLALVYPNLYRLKFSTYFDWK